MSGGGKSGGNTGGDLANLSAQLMQSGGTFLSRLFAQGSEAAKTGGVGAQVPMIQQAVQQSRQATSQAMTDARGNLARTGMGSSTQGQSALASLGLQGAQATEAIPTTFAQNLINALIGAGAQTTGQATSALTGAAQAANANRAIGVSAASPWLTAAAGTGALLGAVGITKGADWLSNLLSPQSTDWTAGTIAEAGQELTNYNLASDLAALG